jgi:hypothetical protein
MKEKRWGRVRRTERMRMRIMVVMMLLMMMTTVIPQGMDAALKLLAPVKEQYGEGLSWADLIVMAGTTGVEQVRVLSR